jgi:hypothetical protein
MFAKIVQKNWEKYLLRRVKEFVQARANLVQWFPRGKLFSIFALKKK